MKFNCLNFLLMPIMWCIAIVVNNSWHGYIPCLIFALFNLLIISRKIAWGKLAYFSLMLAPAIAASYLTAQVFGVGIANSNSQVAALNLCVRIYSLSIISFAYLIAMPKEQILINLMQRKILPVSIGFGLGATLNAFGYFAAEFRRIQLAYQMRFFRKYYSPKIILPLLVAGARYAHNVSISMVSRGLNSKRSYVHSLEFFSLSDYILWLVNIFVLYYFYGR